MDSKYKIYMITCDKTSHILRLTIPLLNKYWHIQKDVKILGFSKPEIELPSDYEFIPMRPFQLTIDNWAQDIANVLENETDEHVIFMLDDFLPIDYLNVEIYDKLVSLMENNSNIVRCSLGIDLYLNSPFDVTEFCDGYEVIDQVQESEYRISTQPSIWKTKYLLSYLKRSTSPWNFEVNNRANDGNRIIATKGKYAFRWIKDSALSARHPNKINVLGLRPSDIKWCLDNALVNEDELQYGMHVGDVPQFKDFGLDFKVDVLKNFNGSARDYNRNYVMYATYYENKM